jgi:formamidopyrimidine-DNA glycosylase
VPELPEVHIYVRQLKGILEGAEIRNARSLHDGFGVPPLGTISRVWRHGKWIMLAVGTDVVAINLGMSGRIQVDGPRPRHTRWEMLLRSSGKRVLLRYVDPRCMGRLRLYTGKLARTVSTNKAPNVGSMFIGLGPDLLSRRMSRDPLPRRVLAWRQALDTTVPIKRALMDQSRVAGLGNIYAAEACWLARVAPDRESRSLTTRELTRLAEKVPVLLKAAIGNGGTSLGDSNSYRDARGVEGKNVGFLHVYGRKGKPCSRCGTIIKAVKAGGRSTYFCPGCQV